MNDKAIFIQHRRRPAVIAPGDKFGRLTVVSEVLRPGKREYYCRCECGAIAQIRSGLLKSGGTKSCGCLRREVASAVHKTHGLSETQTYYSWGGMIARCTNPKDLRWKWYGARGIMVCSAWIKFDAFLADMGECPPGHTIERNDVHGHYEPANCAWVTKRAQHWNTTKTRWIDFKGQRKALAEWCEILAVSPTVVRDRLQRGWDATRALTEPKHG